MANVMFKRGSQAALANVTPQDGVFYLTEDTGRLYVGQGNNLVELNKSITTVTSIQAAAGGGYEVVTPASGIRPVESGEFYYYGGTTASPANILMIGQDNGKLLQINQDTNTYITSTTSTAGLNGNVITINQAAIMNDSSSATFATKIYAGNNITLGTSGTNGVSIAAADSVLKLGDVSTTSVQLYVDSTTGSAITLKSNATNGISFSKTGNELTLTLPDAIAVPSYNLTHGGSGAVEQITLKKDNAALDTINLGGVTVNYGASGTAVAISSYDSTTNTNALSLDVYTKDEINDKFSGIASAMDYMGAVSSIPASTSGSGASGALTAGDMWKANAPFVIPANQSASSTTADVNIGDLIIYNGSAWDVIPSGDDQTISVVASTATKDIQIHDGSNYIGKLGFDSQSGDAAIEFVTTSSTTSELVVKANLKQLSTAPSATYATTSAAASGTVDLGNGHDVVTGISVDNYGRVTEYKKAKYVAPSDQTLTLTPATSGTDYIVDFALSGDSTTHTLSSKSLKIDGSSNNVTINLEWGTFGDN